MVHHSHVLCSYCTDDTMELIAEKGVVASLRNEPFSYFKLIVSANAQNNCCYC